MLYQMSESIADLKKKRDYVSELNPRVRVRLLNKPPYNSDLSALILNYSSNYYEQVEFVSRGGFEPHARAMTSLDETERA